MKPGEKAIIAWIIFCALLAAGIVGVLMWAVVKVVTTYT